MKVKYFIPVIIALFTLALTSCNDDDAITLLDEVQVSTSYVSIPMDGGSATITVKANDSWQFEKLFRQITKNSDGTNDTTYTETPTWLNISQMSGSAGETQITFSADGTLNGRNTEVRLQCGGRTQIINVIQGLAVVSDATCAQVIAGPESKTYRVTGTVTSIVNTTYGNWYLADETGEIYIYGTLDANGGTKNFLSWGLEVGDQITVEGPKTVYNGTVELVDVTVVKIEKSLIKVASVDPENAQFPLEGGDITVNLTCKGNGVSVDIPEDAKGWLSMTSISGGAEPVVKFHAAPNTGGDRNTKVVFRTTDNSGKEYTSELTLTQVGAIVNATIAEFLAAPVGDTQYRITGVITSVANYGRGNIYIRDFSGETYVYGSGAQGEFENIGLDEGDIITLVGKRAAYQGNPQMSGAIIEGYKVVTALSIAEFIAKEPDPNTFYRVTGTIDEIANTTYGNLYLTDGTNRLYVYGCYPGYGATGDARKNFLEAANIEVGDQLTMIGYRETYNGTVELSGGIYFNHVKP